ncbi:NUDIX hydrolase [Synechocystis sp. LKSZ1]|uniref:NUDIX hydrolase n=1 Tax=Synechocystis sp. LKSZ1 TaxID=3144951 RepID=UPI00336C1CEB
MLTRLWQIGKTVLGLLLRHPVTGVSLIPILPDGRFVLVQRRDTGQWGLPGGLVDWGETIEKTAERELQEETGLNLVAIEGLVGVYSAPERDPRTHSICIFLAVKASGPMTVGDTAEIQDVAAFTREQLPLGNLAHDHDRQLQDFFAGKTIIA